MLTRRARVGLILSVVWLIVCMIALSGRCQVKPPAVRGDRIISPSAIPTPAP